MLVLNEIDSPQIRRQAAQNVVTEKSGIQEPVRQAKTILNSWHVFLPTNMFEIIVKYTYVYIEKIRPSFIKERDTSDKYIVEIKSVIGVLYILAKYYFCTFFSDN